MRRGKELKMRDKKSAGRKIQRTERGERYWRDEHNRPDDRASRKGKRGIKGTNATGRVFIWMSHRGKRWEAVIRKTNHFIHKT